MTGLPDETGKNPAQQRGFSVLGLGEIAIRCNDLARMTAFYRDVIGLEILSEREGLVFFMLDNGVAGHTAVLALFDKARNPEIPNAPEVSRSSLHHLALVVTSKGQQAAQKWFESQGIASKIELFDWIGWRGLFVHDPEGNTVELVAALRPD